MFPPIGVILQGVGGIFFPDTNDETSWRSWGTHPPPPHTLQKNLFSKFGAKNQMNGAKIQIHGAKTQIHGAKIQIFDLKFKKMNFCTTKNLPLCTRKTPNLTPTHPLIGHSPAEK